MDFHENHLFGEEKSAQLKETLAMPTGDTPKSFYPCGNASSVTLPRQVWALAPCSRRACHTFFAWLRARRAWFHFRRCSLKSLQTHLLNLFIQTVTLPPPRTNMLQGAADSAVGHEYCSVSLYRRCYNKLITKIFEHPPGML